VENKENPEFVDIEDYDVDESYDEYEGAY